MNSHQPQSNIQTLQKNITDLKTDTAYLKKIILQIKEAKSSSDDSSDLKKIEDTINAA